MLCLTLEITNMPEWKHASINCTVPPPRTVCLLYLVAELSMYWQMRYYCYIMNNKFCTEL